MKGKTARPSHPVSSPSEGGLHNELQHKLKANPFVVPEGYFESLPARIQQRADSTPKVAPIRPFPLKAMLWAAAAAVLIIMSMVVFLRYEIKERHALLLSQNEYTIKNLLADKADSTRGNDSNSKMAQPANKIAISANNKQLPAEGVRPQMKTGQTTASAKEFDRVIKTLENEGVSDEDIMQYLLDENIDPTDLSN